MTHWQEPCDTHSQKLLNLIGEPINIMHTAGYTALNVTQQTVIAEEGKGRRYQVLTVGFVYRNSGEIEFHSYWIDEVRRQLKEVKSSGQANEANDGDKHRKHEKEGN